MAGSLGKSGPAESSHPSAASDGWSRLLSTSVLGCVSLISSLRSEARLSQPAMPAGAASGWRGGTPAGWVAHSNAASCWG